MSMCRTASFWGSCLVTFLWGIAGAVGRVDLLIEHDAILTQNVDGDLRITGGAIVVAQRIDVSGNVTIEDGAQFYAQGVWIGGRLIANSAGHVTVRKHNMRRSRVFGDIEIRNAVGIVRLFDVRADGHVAILDGLSPDIVIRNSFVRGDLQIFNNLVDRAIHVDQTWIFGNFQERNNVPAATTRGNFVFGPPALGSFLELRVAGAAADERFALELDGERVREWTATQSLRSFPFLTYFPVAPDQVRVVLLNEGESPAGGERRLQVDWMAIETEVYQTESPAVYSTGTWRPDDAVLPGFRESEFLHVQGHFQYGLAGLGNAVLVYNLNQLLPDDWSWDWVDDGLDIWLDVMDANDESRLAMRFGSAGVLSEIYDTQNHNPLLAPSFQGERTDRVCQWTLWELGTNLVHDLPELPWYEDRFNMTQAGNALGEFHGTARVELEAIPGQLDVWATVQRQWRPELDPSMEGSIACLTRYSALRGGSLLVRQVVRLDETRLFGEPVQVEYPHFEYWNPFSDQAFDSLAFAVDEQGNPSHWYADSYNIPEFPHWPVAETRGWAAVYDRARLRHRPAIGLVFGRENGQVVLADGTSVDLPAFVFNSMDFAGGMALMPAIEPGSIPPGTLIDQSYLLIFLDGIDASTGGRLDALANRLPAPRVYYPGAPLSSDMEFLAARLVDLPAVPPFYTDHLSTVD